MSRDFLNLARIMSESTELGGLRMLCVHENVPDYKRTTSIKCPICKNRIFDVPDGARVRTRSHGRHPPDVNIVLIKCSKCNNQFGISIEQS